MVPRKTYQQINSESTYRYLVFFGEDTLYLSFLPKVNWFEQGEFGYDFQEAHTLSHQIKQKLTHRKNSWKGKRLESSFNTWGDCCSGAIGRGEGGGLHGGWNLTLGLWPHIGNAYCYSTLQAEAVCTATALSRPAATAQKGEKYATRRAVLHLPACLPPNTNCIALEERPKYSDQQPAALKGVHPHAWVQGTDSWEGFKALWGNVLLQVVAPCLASNKIRTTILEIAPCEVLPGAPHLQPVHPFFYSLKKKM